jgi:hypothetical protein
MSSSLAPLSLFSAASLLPVALEEQLISGGVCTMYCVDLGSSGECRRFTGARFSCFSSPDKISNGTVALSR